MISESSDRDARQDQQIAWAKEVDELCDQFEQLLLSGARPSIEEYLGRLPAAYQTTAIGKFVGIELELRRAAGEAIDANSYRARFPNHTEIIDQELEHLDRCGIGGRSPTGHTCQSTATKWVTAPNGRSSTVWTAPRFGRLRSHRYIRGSAYNDQYHVSSVVST